MWQAEAILEAAVGALRAREAAFAAEQGYRGLDSLDEVELHPVLADGLARELACDAGAAEHGATRVLREQAYPAEWRKKRGKRGKQGDQADALPREQDRRRCDLVLIPECAGAAEPAQGAASTDSSGGSLRDGSSRLIADELVGLRRARAEREALRGTLFEAVAPEVSGAEEARGGLLAAPVSAADAFWLEVKVVGQFCYTSGVPGPNGTYASQLVRGVGADIRKLRDDPSIVRGAALLVLFAADELVASHDLLALSHRCIDAGLPIRSPLAAGFAIPDRIGNQWCAVWLAEMTGAGRTEE